MLHDKVDWIVLPDGKIYGDEGGVMLEAIWIEQIEVPAVGPQGPEAYAAVERGAPTDRQQQQQAATALERYLPQASSDADKDGRTTLNPPARIVIYRTVLRENPGIAAV